MRRRFVFKRFRWAGGQVAADRFGAKRKFATKGNIGWAGAGRTVRAALVSALVLAGGSATARAEQITIVAFGTSNTAGKGLSSTEAYPAQLEAMLRARGYDVRIINMGVNGDTTAGMMARVDSVPDGTRLVLLEWARRNEARAGITDSAARMGAIQARLQARHIKTINIGGIFRREFDAAGAGSSLLIPNDIHMNAAGYRKVAAQVLPQVAAVLGRSK